MLESDHSNALPANSQEPSTPTVKIKLKNSAETAHSRVFSSTNSFRNKIVILATLGLEFSQKGSFSQEHDLLDSGNQSNFITSEFANILGLQKNIYKYANNRHL
ncbi:hypothetical protein CEXT_427561 [Caerostris extrusa]|uniref:Uncharacterized protein n=1 Tax=Caerostris extrusa TaxID=172846 RepID=A0AAV4R9K8_CAEEX|nr:hypothetical protein CEXT_427561 [Caerostris extrusa]